MHWYQRRRTEPRAYLEPKWLRGCTDLLMSLCLNHFQLKVHSGVCSSSILRRQFAVSTLHPASSAFLFHVVMIPLSCAVSSVNSTGASTVHTCCCRFAIPLSSKPHHIQQHNFCTKFCFICDFNRRVPAGKGQLAPCSPWPSKHGTA